VTYKQYVKIRSSDRARNVMNTNKLRAETPTKKQQHRPTTKRNMDE
jgi:hypothetical protein